VSAENALSLVGVGHDLATIVISDEAFPVHQFSVEELQYPFAPSSGTRLPIRHEPNVSRAVSFMRLNALNQKSFQKPHGVNLPDSCWRKERRCRFGFKFTRE
jgi:hypothetical protein